MSKSSRRWSRELNRTIDDALGIGVGTKISIVVFCGIVGVTGFVLIRDCGGRLLSNRDKIDTEKYFNYCIDYKNQGVSIIKLEKYNDYEGNTVDFYTQDGLHILTSIENAELLKASNYTSVYNRALELTQGCEDDIICYDEMRNLIISSEVGFWNKDILNNDYDFNYVITENELGVNVTNISQWKDWEKDDKLQYKDADGNVHLTTYKNAKLVNGKYTGYENAIYDYALSLAGSEDRLNGDVDKLNDKVKVLIH